MGKTVEQRVIEIVEQQLGLGGNEPVTAEQHILNDLGGDSLDFIEIVMAIEEEFEIEISDDAAEGAQTVQEAIDLVKRLVD
ncbi:acyl carrier protein [Microvirga lupini]|uniref:Acyl carrier protein n=1 Tax=Microvirga lupini TaxID=420324 RepID=A0A7W4VI49_9HYPH|nr:acyl carrier protein [Microvirga lupini]MBB3017650.1 acyl carrier protein [Microvirga lupini]